MKKLVLSVCIAVATLFSTVYGQRQMENLDRGLVAVKVTNGVFISWRISATEFTNVGYNLYRSGTKIASISSTEASNYTDLSGTLTSTYSIKAVVDGVEQAASTPASVWANIYKTVPLAIPAGGTTPDAVAYTYTANDCSTGDVDGDGQLEIILKWDPTNSKDNSQSGYTGNVYLDAYKLDGTRLWRIDLGMNIRAGAHYTQFLVFDFDGDGIAEVVCKTAPGTKDGAGNYLTGAATGTDNSVDYRNTNGYILSGPEYLTVFAGQTGKELQTINYEPARGTVTAWGDNYGNRVDRFLACVAYLDGKTPSLVMCRGYYTRCYLTAYDWKNGTLTKKWAFDSNTTGNSGYAGQGCHNLCVGDIDSDGFDEIIYGSCTIDHNGIGKYTTGLGHGDAVHLGDFNPDRPGLEVWQAHESTGSNGGYGATFRDANTGDILFSFPASGDVGRGLVADVDATNKGAECWAAGSPLYSCTGATVSTSQPASDNFGIWWDGDDLREILDGNILDKYGVGRELTIYNYGTASSCNGTKKNPNLQADILGDWREEVILHSSDNSNLLIFTTTAPTSRRLYTLMHDPMYRLGIAWQNVAYNQPPDVSFYLGGGMSTPPIPTIIYTQTISFPALVTKAVGDADFTPGASATSSLPVSYSSSNAAVATITNGNIHIIGTGTTVITASQAGNGLYTAAKSVTQSLTVSSHTALQAPEKKTICLYPNPVSGNTITLKLPTEYRSEMSIVIVDGMGRSIKKEVKKGENLYHIDVASFPQGSYVLKIKSADIQKAIPFIKL